MDTHETFLKDIIAESQVWMSHADTILETPSTFHVIASTMDVRVAAYHIENEKTYGLQFHPEVVHTVQGKQLLKNFVNLVP